MSTRTGTTPTSAYNPDSPLGHSGAAEVPVFQPHIGIDTLKAVTDGLSIGWLGMGSLTKAFEDGISEFLGLTDRYVVATNTGTSALHLALLTAGVGRGDEVIVPSFNYVADHQAISMTGADPVFCDIREDNLGIDCDKAEELICPRTKAIIALHFAGIPCDIEGVYDLAKRRGLRLIEDATHAFGTLYRGRAVGSFGDITCFSFDPVKVITSLDGGAVVVGDQQELEPLRQMRILGVDKDTTERYRNRRAWEYDVVRQGFRYHLTNINASIGLSQLHRAAEFIANRQSYCRLYNQILRSVDAIVTPRTNYTDISPFIYYIRVRDRARQTLIARLRERGIATGIHFLPVHEHSYYSSCRKGDLSVTELIGEEILTIPLHSFMRRELVEMIADAIVEFFGSGSR